MARLCGRPGCSEVGAVAYGMVPEDLVFWIAPFEEAPISDASVLCRRHADAMVVPLGWTLDDRRESALRLFRPRPPRNASASPKHSSPAPKRRSSRTRGASERGVGEQLQIDGTGEIDRPTVADGATDDDGRASEAAPWEPAFDPDDDLDGLLEVRSPLLARAFRGTDRPKS